MHKSLKCISNEDSTILMLGSFPSEASRKAGEFYGSKRNQFWRLIFNVFDETYTKETSYKEKIDFLYNHNIALWDVIEECETEGSLDSEIKNPKFNDVKQFVSEHSNITKIFCNGQMVYNLVKKMDIQTVKIEVLPSSSPTNTMKYETKLSLWKEKILN